MAMTVKLILLVSLSLLVSLTSSQPNLNATTIPAGSDGSNPLISAVEGTINVSMTCEVFRISDGVQRQTSWTLIRNGSENVNFLFTNGLGRENFENFVVVEPLREHLTILEFNSSFDNTQMGCGSGSEVAAKFDLRIIKPPVLINASTVQIAAEGDPFSLNIEAIAGFPAIPDNFSWFFNDLPISDDSVNPNVTEYPIIVFDYVNRSSAGNYTVSVSNEGGTASTFFILDVQYVPNGVSLSGPVYVLAGDDIILIAFKEIDGNPTPSSTWSIHGSTLTDTRFNTSILGQLTISSTSVSDAGNYTNSLSNTVNGDPKNITNSIELIVAEPPSMPRNLVFVGVGAEFVNITWVNPMILGTPVFSTFRIEAISSINIINITISATNPINVDFVNQHIVTGLKPSTEYSLTIRALSTVEQFGVLFSNQSEVLLFNTTLGAPSISSAVLANVNGNLSVSWEFRHTGGSGLETIIVQCSEEDNEDSMDEASADPLAVVKYCMTNEECSPGSVSIGPIVAGVNYSCLVTADNGIDSDKMRTNYRVATTGIPSVPVINSIEGGAGSASLTLKVDQFGVNDASDFTFIVSVFESSNIPTYKQMITPMSIDSFIVTIDVNDLPAGNYAFTVASSNPYGSSMPSNRSNEVMVQPVVTSTTTSTTTSTLGPTTTSTSTSTMDRTTSVTTLSSTSSSSIGVTEPTIPPPRSNRLSGGAVAGIVIAILILVAIIAIVVFIVIYIVYQNRGGSYQVEPGKRGGVKVEEFDIDLGTELQSKESAQVVPEKPPETNEYSSVEPKAELHYADLADFGPVKSKGQSVPAPQAAKPMPIEEVQYAVIVPQEKKPQGAEDGQ